MNYFTFRQNPDYTDVILPDLHPLSNSNLESKNGLTSWCGSAHPHAVTDFEAGILNVASHASVLSGAAHRFALRSRRTSS